MSDIRFNRWLHQSGTGGVSQDSSGHIGIGTTVPTMALDVRGDVNIGNTININNASGIISATTFTGTTGTFSGNVSAVDGTFTGDVTIAGTLTYEDVANIDAVGIITAQSDIIVGGGLTVTGISTFNNDVKLLDNDKLKFGIGEDLQIYHTGNHSRIYDSGVGKLQLGSDTQVEILNGSFSVPIAQFNPGGSVVLRHNTTTRLETANTGAVVTGILTATTFSGNLTGNVTGDLTGNLAGISSIAAISSSISATAGDIFVYDTRKDSDGGAWRKRTQHTSWYNETLGTATRGTRKEFPAVAVIVATSSGVTIYDGDDPDLPMWMVFEDTEADMINTHNVNPNSFSLSALNANVLVGSHHPSYGEANVINFISDNGVSYYSAHSGDYRGSISQRNDALSQTINSNYGTLVNSVVKDVAMTVLPNAPIDDATGLPVPTIAVATNGGVSVIKDDGTVVDHVDSAGGQSTQVAFTQDGKLAHSHDGHTGIRIDSLRSSDFTYGSNKVARHNSEEFYINYGLILSGWSGNAPKLNTGSFNSGGQIVPVQDNILAERADTGLNLLARDFPGSPNNNRIAYTTTSYNTGWMQGDIKGAFLSDTDTTNVTGSELITNTDFSSDLSGWSNGNPSQFTRVTTNVGGDTDGKLMYYAVDNNVRTFHQNVTCVAGEKYVLSLRACSDTANAMVIDIDGTNVITIDDNNNAAFITKQHTFTAGSTSVRIRIESAAANRSYFTDFSVRLAVEDRSVNDNGLQVFGTITKSAVATGADLVAYSGFSASNYLQQPYNSDLDFGTGDFSIMFWYKATAGDYTAQCFLHRGDGGAGTWGSGKIIQIEFNGTNIAAFLAESAFSSFDTVAIPGATAATGQWQHYTLIRRASFVGAYLNGELKDSTISNRDLSNTSAKTWIGERPNNSRPLDTTSLALFRMSASAPSDEQIKKIYNDEKHLYKENAKATLYGSSDAVTALGYDEDTELLHVGTSSGRSDFQGLRRINNTTTAVTTAISASDDLIAEQ
jgi:hypothetical protein